MKNVCIFATSKFYFSWGSESCPTIALHVGLFLCPYAYNDTRRLTPCIHYNGVCKPREKDLDNGKWTPFFSAHTSKFSHIMTNKKDNAVTYCEALTFNASKKSLTPILIGGEPYFIANEVCEILEISNSRDAVGRLDSDEKLTSVMSTSGQNRQVNLVNESGLYSLIFQSRKPQAKIFRKWVTSEVLPAIRKTGNYESKQRNNPCELADLLANAALVLGSYRALAKEIGVSESVISELRSNKRKHSETMTEHIIIACRHIVSDDSSISYVMSKIKFRTGQEKNNRLIKALALLCHVPDNDLRTSIANELTGGLV